MKDTRTRIVIISILFILSLFSYLLVKPKTQKEDGSDGVDKEGFMNLESMWQSNCPNLLIKKDGKIFLQNTRKAVVPGINPIEFNDISEYDEFVEWLRSQGIRCPILYLEHENNAQGENGYRLMRNVDDKGINMTPVLDEIYNRLPNQQKLSDAGYTANNFPGFDPNNQYQGVETPLDKLHHIQADYNISDNPMDTNWGGPFVTQKSIQRGKYDMNTSKNRKSPTELALEAQKK
jgi:hypothetical protein